MPTSDDLDERLRSVERALTSDDREFTDLQATADLQRRIEDLDDRLSAVEDRLCDLEAAVQALRGYVGNVRAVNREVERRADAALAAVESLDAGAAEPAPIYPPPGRPPVSNGDVNANADDSVDVDEETTLLDRVREAL